MHITLKIHASAKIVWYSDSTYKITLEKYDYIQIK